MNRIIRYTFFILCILASAESHAQVSYRQFKSQQDLNLKAELGLELWNYYTRSDLDSLKIAAFDLLLAAAEEEHEFARAVGSRMLGDYLYRTGKIEQGLEYLNLALGFFEKREDYVVASEVWNAIGHAYQLDGSLNKSKDAYKKSLQLGEQSTDATAAFNAKLGLGRTYILAGDTTTGMSIWHSYKQLSLEAEKYEAAADVYAFMAMIESERGNKDQSSEYYNLSIEYGGRSSSKSYRANRFANLGIQKFGEADYDSSLYFFKKSLELRLELNNMRQILEGYYNLGFYYMSVDSLDKCSEYFDLVLEKAEEHKLWVDLSDYLKEFIDIYGELGRNELIAVYKTRLVEVDEIIKDKNSTDEKILKELDLNFSDKRKKQVEMKDPGGIDWTLFIVIVLAALVILFLFLERKRFIN
ncbi:MAG: hypothetical protein Crog4KO_15150 [Crocinitomicaceae bacterium]